LKEDDERQQLYISYGKKSDKELMLNFGLTPHKVGEDETEREETKRCKQLAENFQMRASVS
jgi:hypothetical protein